MPFIKPPNLLLIGALAYLLSACEGSSAPSSPEDDSVVVVSFSVDCVQLDCTVNILPTLVGSDSLSSLVCEMGDGGQYDVFAGAGPYSDFSYTYAAPANYDITCRAESPDATADSDTISVNVVGSDAQDNGGGGQGASGSSTWGMMTWGSGTWQSAVTE